MGGEFIEAYGSWSSTGDVLLVGRGCGELLTAPRHRGGRTFGPSSDEINW